MHTCIHPYLPACLPTYLHIYHTYICIYTYIHTYLLTYIHTHIHTCMCIHLCNSSLKELRDVGLSSPGFGVMRALSDLAQRPEQAQPLLPHVVKLLTPRPHFLGGFVVAFSSDFQVWSLYSRTCQGENTMFYRALGCTFLVISRVGGAMLHACNRAKYMEKVEYMRICISHITICLVDILHSLYAYLHIHIHIYKRFYSYVCLSIHLSICVYLHPPRGLEV